MLLWKALKNRKVRMLWFGQAFSCIGDEIYRVAFIWLSVQWIGSKTGYLTSLQMVMAFLANIFWTRLVDHLHSEQAMIRLDIYRGIIVMIPVFLYLLHLPSFMVLAFCSLLLSGLGALFEPVAMETIPKVADEPFVLKAANGLMSTTIRLARVVGPMIVGVLSRFIPIIHFFTLDALSFAFSAYSVRSLKIEALPSKEKSPFAWRSFLDSLINSFELLKSQPPVFRSLMAKCFIAGAWGLAYTLGLALLANELSPGNVATFGTMMSAYGAGNILGVFIFGNLHRSTPERMVYHGLMWLGTFFVFAGVCKNFVLLTILLALSALGGPWNDLPFADLVQTHFPTTSISKIYRLRVILDTLAQLLMMLISPLLFHLFSVRTVIVACGVLMLGGGVCGEWRRRRASHPSFVSQKRWGLP